MNDVVIRAENLRKIYKLYSRPEYRLLDMLGLLRETPDRVRNHPAVDGVDLEIRRGEKVGVIGRNGAGKSTLLKLITRVIEPTSGTLEVTASTHALLQIGTGFHPDFTGRQNALTYLASYGIFGDKAERLLQEIISFSEIESYIDQPVKTYSTGMAMRLMFATSTSIAPEILILDEILSVGDAYFSHKSFERIREMTERDGVTLLMVSHDISRSTMLCTRLIWIDGGRVRMDGSPAEVANRYALSIREQEEQRLRQKRVETVNRELVERAPEPEAADSPQAASSTVFGQIRRKGGMPPTEHLPIAGVGVSRDGVELGLLSTDPGRESSHAALVLDEGETNWSGVEEIEGRPVRSFAKHGSVFHRVAFLLKTDPARPSAADAETVECAVEVLDTHADTFLLEIFPDAGTQTCLRGEFTTEGSGGWKTFRFSAHRTSEAERVQGKVRFGTQRMSITKVSFRDETGRDTHVFRVGGRLEVVLNYAINDPSFRGRPTIQVNFQRNGVRLGRMVLENHLFDAGKKKTGELRAAFDPLRMGPGEYVVNLAVMGEGGYTSKVAPKYFTANPNLLDHHTRAYEIKVETTGKMLVDDLAFLHEATWEVDGERFGASTYYVDDEERPGDAA